MRSSLTVKIVLVAILGVSAYGSSLARFDETPLYTSDSPTMSKSRSEARDFVEPTSAIDIELIQTYARPLFSQNRRPFVPRPQVVEQPVVAEVAAQQPSALPRRLLLIGTNVGGATPSALVRNQESAEVRWLEVGDAFDGWILAGATADQAAFTCIAATANDCDYKLTLYSNRSDP